MATIETTVVITAADETEYAELSKRILALEPETKQRVTTDDTTQKVTVTETRAQEVRA